MDSGDGGAGVGEENGGEREEDGRKEEVSLSVSLSL